MAFAGFDLPNINDNNLSDAQERRKILEYLFQLTEQLRFVLSNLDEDNLSDNIKESIQGAYEVSNAISQRVEDTEKGLGSIRKQTAEGFSQVVYKSSVIRDINAATEFTQDGEKIKIKAPNISLEGIVTANDNFKILADGSIEANNGIFSGALNSNGGKIGNMTVGQNAEIAGDFHIAGNLVVDGSYPVGTLSSDVLHITDGSTTWAVLTHGTISGGTASSSTYSIITPAKGGWNIRIFPDTSATSLGTTVSGKSYVFSGFNGAWFNITHSCDGNGGNMQALANGGGWIRPDQFSTRIVTI